MRYPKYIKQNDTIGFVSPSFGCGTDPYISAFENARHKLRQRGYRDDAGYNCRKTDGIGRSTNARDCAREFMDYYKSDKNQALISCGGGELMCEILDFIDFDKLKALEPKWFMGYSDNTHMTFLLTTICDTAAVYGPCAPAFGMEPWHKALEDAIGILEGKVNTVKNYDGWEAVSLKNEENPLKPYNITEPFKLKKFINSSMDFSSMDFSLMNFSSLGTDEALSFSGRLLGGCLDCLVNISGTKFDNVKSFTEKYKEDGIIWFLESCDLNVMSIRRAMWQLDASGWFKYAKGFIIGRPYCMREDVKNGASMMGLDQYSAVLEIVKKYDVPVIMDADIGHLPPMMPLVLGSMADVQAKENSLTIKMNMK